MNYLSLLVPFAYLGILVSSLATFSSLYRKRKATQSHSLAPYFPPHAARNVYLSLLHHSDDNEGNEKGAKVPDSILRAALLARAQEDITRIIEIRSRKQPLNTLLARGVLGDEIWQRLLRAEQELEAEVKDVVQEANALATNWGQTIFQSASEMAANSALKKKLAAIAAGVEPEKEWWEQRRASVKEGFMRELNMEDEAAKRPEKKEVAAATPPVVEKVKEGTKGQSSDEFEEAVLVENPAQGAAGEGGGGGGGGGGGKGKKKKGKK